MSQRNPFNPQRRQWLRQAALATLAAPLAPGLWAQTRPAAASPRLASTLRIVIPANPAGGWDQTGHALGAALLAVGAAEQVVYENIAGQGGIVGLAQYSERYRNDPNTLMIGGMVLVGAVALHKPALGLEQLQPLARLTSDYLVAAVAANSPIRSIKDLAQALRQDLPSVAIAGGSAGGVDHLFAGMLARAAKAQPQQLVYQPFSGGAGVIEALRSGQAQLGLAGYSEFGNAIAAGQLRALGVSARRSTWDLPALREQGLDAVMANWRGVFTGKGVTAERQAQLLAAIELASGHDSWARNLKSKRWESAWLSGKNLEDFIALELSTAQVMAYLLKLKA